MDTADLTAIDRSTSPCFKTALGVVRVATREQIELLPEWQTTFAHERKDHRYYEIVEDTIIQGFDYRYFVLEDGRGNVRAIQPFIILQQDFVQGAGPRIQGFVRAVRMLFPRFLTIRSLMIGCAAGEGALDSTNVGQTRWVADCLAGALKACARKLKTPMVVWKEFPISARPALDGLQQHGFTRVPSLPFAKLAIPFKSFDEYLEKVLSKNGRKSLRRKFKESAERGSIQMQVTSDVTPYLDEVYPLYLQVYNKSTLQFEKLTKEYFTRISREMADKARFFIWRLEGRAVAFNFCMLNKDENRDEIWDEVIGLDYAIAYDLHLYFITIRDVLHWAMENGIGWYVSGGQGFEPKLHLRCHLLPVDLYVMHTSPIANFIMRRVLPLVEPTRGDEILRKYPNYADVWGEG